MATPPACWQVIHTAELLEQILLDTMPTTWEPDPDLDPRHENRLYHIDLNRRRRLLCSQRVCKAFKDTITSSPKLREQLFLSPPKPQLQHLNPFFAQEFRSSINLSASSTFTCRVLWSTAYISLRSTSWPPDPPLIMAATREASWRQMYLGRRIVEVRFTTEEVSGVDRKMLKREFDSWRSGTLEPKMGDLMDGVLETWHAFLGTLPKWREAMRLAYGED